MLKNNYENAFFLNSIKKVINKKNSNVFEIAFVGYSNSGKSSTINVLTNKKKLARISKTPGRTKLINFFSVSENYYLVDMPGYGYAKTVKSLRLKWDKIIIEYLKMRTCLKGLVLLMDIRHPMKPYDEDIIRIAIKFSIPILVLLNKSDKLTLEKQRKQLQIVSKKLYQFSPKNFNILLFSALKKIGIQELRQQLDNWFFQ